MGDPYSSFSIFAHCCPSHLWSACSQPSPYLRPTRCHEWLSVLMSLRGLSETSRLITPEPFHA